MTNNPQTTPERLAFEEGAMKMRWIISKFVQTQYKEALMSAEIRQLPLPIFTEYKS